MSNASKYEGHTPGPWQVGFYDGSGTFEDVDEGAWIVRSDELKVQTGTDVIVAGGQNDSQRVGVLSPPDAALIADAPKLLQERDELAELLDKVLAGCTNFQPRPNGDGGWKCLICGAMWQDLAHGPVTHCTNGDCPTVDARAALAKVEGVE